MNIEIILAALGGFTLGGSCMGLILRKNVQSKPSIVTEKVQNSDKEPFTIHKIVINDQSNNSYLFLTILNLISSILILMKAILPI